MPNQRDPRKKQIGLYVEPRIKEEIARLGVEEATAVEMLVVEALIRHGYLESAEVERLASDNRLRAGSILWLRSIGVLKDPRGPQAPAQKRHAKG